MLADIQAVFSPKRLLRTAPEPETCPVQKLAQTINAGKQTLQVYTPCSIRVRNSLIASTPGGVPSNSSGLRPSSAIAG